MLRGVAFWQKYTRKIFFFFSADVYFEVLVIEERPLRVIKIGPKLPDILVGVRPTIVVRECVESIHQFEIYRAHSRAFGYIYGGTSYTAYIYLR